MGGVLAVGEQAQVWGAKESVVDLQHDLCTGVWARGRGPQMWHLPRLGLAAKVGRILRRSL